MSLMLERDVDTLGTTPPDAKTRLRIIDCDIHPYLRTPRDLDPFLSARWRQHLAEYAEELIFVDRAAWELKIDGYVGAGRARAE